MRLLIVALSATLAFGKTFDDPCSRIGDCLSCVDSLNDCGWCSTNVIYDSGKIGTQCVGPRSGEHFTCAGIYSTEECVAGYICNNQTFKCEMGPPGAGTTLATCERECIAPTPPGPPPPPGSGWVCEVSLGKCKPAGIGKGIPRAACLAGCVLPPPPTPPVPPPSPPPASKVYGCTDNYTCVVVPPGTPGATSLDICKEECKPPPPPSPPTPPFPTPPTPPVPPAPPAPPSPPVPPTPPAKVYKCDYETGKCYAVPPGTEGASSLLICKKICQATPPPPSPPTGYKCRFDDFKCVLGGTLTKEGCEEACLGFYACDHSTNTCKSVNASTPGATSLKICEETCVTNWECDSDELKCHKIATNNGTTKAQCENFCVTSYTCQDDLTCKAGPPGHGIVNKTRCEDLCVPSYQCDVDTLKCNEVPPSKGTSLDRCLLGCVTNYFCNEDWQCVPVPPGQGYHNASTCKAHCKKPPPYYKCNYNTYTCDEVPAGSPPPATPDKAHCESICVVSPPTPGPPSGLKGLWRALMVQNDYPAGEYDADFGDVKATIVSKDGVILEGNVATAANGSILITLTSGADSGKVVVGVFQSQGSGAETTYGELALGEPNGPAPVSVTRAMGTEGQTVLVMAKCLSQACKFFMEEKAKARASVLSFGDKFALPVAKTYVNDPCLAHGTSCQVCVPNQKLH